jgi:hypothetical protein
MLVAHRADAGLERDGVDVPATVVPRACQGVIPIGKAQFLTETGLVSSTADLRRALHHSLGRNPSSFAISITSPLCTITKTRG